MTLAVLITELDKRTSAWLKLKKDYVLGLGDSLDLVPIGAWHGNGRKAAWWSPILLAVWDERIGQLVGVCKCMSGEYLIHFSIISELIIEKGFTDEFYKVRKYDSRMKVCTDSNSGSC